MKLVGPLLFLFLMPAFVSACSNAKNGIMTPTEREIARIAGQYATVQYPNFDTVKYSPIIHDRGDTWEVEYELPKRLIGGTPVIVIEKNTLKILRSFHTQ